MEYTNKKDEYDQDKQFILSLMDHLSNVNKCIRW